MARAVTQAAPNRTTATPDWMRRNWKWFLPLVAALLLACCVVGALAALLDVFGTIRRSPLYRPALAQIQAHGPIQAELGTPIEAGRLYSGQVDDEAAAILFHVHGPRGKGTVQLEGERTDDASWQITSLRVHTDGPNGPKQIVLVGSEESSE